MNDDYYAADYGRDSSPVAAPSSLAEQRDELLAACELYEKAITALLQSNPTASVSVFVALQVVEARQKGNAAIAKAKK